MKGKHVPLEWTKTSGRHLEWWDDPGVPLAFPVESASSGDATGTPEILSRHTVKGYLVSSYEGEKGLLWMLAGLSCFLSSGDGYVGELLELQQGCEGPFGSSRG